MTIEISDLKNLSDADARAIRAIAEELNRARGKFPRFKSAHEGWAVLLEEVDELWEVVKSKGRIRSRLQEEATQVGAMAIRFLVDIADKAQPVSDDYLNAMGECDRLVEGRLTADQPPGTASPDGAALPPVESRGPDRQGAIR